MKVLSFGFMDHLRPVPDTKFVGKLTSMLQQAQLAGARYGLGASLNL